MIKYLLWEDRMNRKPYILLSLGVFISFLLLNPQDTNASPISEYLTFILLYFKLAWTTQRLHDLSFSGFWSLILIPITIATHGGSFISFVGWTGNFIFWACLSFVRGTEGANDYGPNPLESNAEPQNSPS